MASARAFFVVGVAALLQPSPSESLRADCSHLPPSTASAAAANDNRVPAGALQGEVLTLRLVLQRATWYPEGEQGCGIGVYAFGEEGKAAQTPAPLIRVPLGTQLRVTVRNALQVSALVS